MKGVKERSRWPLWLLTVSFAVIYPIVVDPSVRSAASTLVILLFAVVLWLIQTRFRRPYRTFYTVALASCLLLIVLIDASWQGDRVLAAITWLVMTILALGWAVLYERTESLTGFIGRPPLL